jgi:predicted transglutaminase-like cysteine proteinase
MDATAFAELQEVNLTVNQTIRARDDRPADDTWELEPEEGDCEDYAITKRSRLIARGWPSSALTLAIVTAPTGPHMVVLAGTDSGDYALDSLTDDIRPWSETGYTFVSRQSAKAPREWVSVKQLS